METMNATGHATKTRRRSQKRAKQGFPYIVEGCPYLKAKMERAVVRKSVVLARILRWIQIVNKGNGMSLMTPAEAIVPERAVRCI